MGRKKVNQKRPLFGPDEPGIAFPGQRGVYLQSGTITLVNRSREEERFSFLLDLAQESLSRSRRVLLYSPLEPAFIYQGLYERFPADVSRKEFERELLEYFFAVEKEETTLAFLRESIKLHQKMEHPHLCVIESGIFREAHRPAQIFSFLRQQAGLYPGIIWLIAADSSIGWRRLSKSAALQLSPRAGKPANKETLSSLFIAG